jgi:MFS family permease
VLLVGALESTVVSDLLTAAAEALGTPPELVSRSAAARAEANGTTTDEILEAWAGGAPAATPKPATEAAPVEPREEPATDTAEAEPEPAEAPPPTIPEAAEPVAAYSEPEPAAEPLEPVAIQERLRTTGRIGTWTGAVLGLFAFVMAAASWSQTATVTGEDTFSPIFVADSRGLLIAVALVSVVFGGLVAAFARAAASWVNPAMQLRSSKSSTAWIGGGLGLVLGIVAGATLGNAIGTPIEGAEGLVELPVLTTLIIMLLGGALLGGVTTLMTQFLGVPSSVEESDQAEVAAVRTRLGNAIGIPLAGLVLLALLVLPFAWTLIQSNHLTSGGAAIVAIITASGILVFASLAGSRPNMKIGLGEFLIAVAGIGIVVLMLFAVLNNLGHSEQEEPAGEEVGIELVVS